MKKKLLSVTSIILVVCLLFTAFPVSAAIVDNGADNNNTSLSNDMNISSTNSLGAMISDELGEEQEKQEENNGINIFSVEVEGNVATAEVETVLDATLIVGIYSEDGIEMYASGKADISKEDEIVEVTIDIEAMPQYFYLKAYIVDSESLKPLCTVYESPNYTQEMQEFFAKTVEDFDEEKVLNLDDDDTNNFAVFNEEVKLIESTPNSANELVSSDYEQKVYVIENADNSITSLQEGEIFSYAYDEEMEMSKNIIIVKVKSISVDGTTATIVGDEIDLEDAFDYIRIEGSGDVSEAEINESLMDDDVELCGFEQYDNNEDEGKNAIEPVGANVEASIKHSFSVNIKGDVLSSSLKFGIDVKINVYLTTLYKYVSVSADYSIKLEATIKATGTLIEKNLPGVTIPLLGGTIDVALEPKFVVRPSVSISVSGTLTGSVGFRFTMGKGFENCSKSPSFKTEIKIKGSLFIGVAMEPKVEVLYGVVSIGLEMLGGVEIEATNTPYSSSDYEQYPSEKHSCTFCLDIKITPKFSLSVEVAFLKKIKGLSFKKTFLQLSAPSLRFYFSADHLKFGLGTCPYKQYLITAVVKDKNGYPIKEANVNLSDGFSYSTDSCGTAKFYLFPGEYTITAEKVQTLVTQNLMIDSIPRTLEFVMDIDNSGGNSGSGNGSGNQSGTSGQGASGWQYDSDSNIPISGNVVAVEVGGSHSAALTRDGTLYTWGNDASGQLGDGSAGTFYNAPRKINSSVGIPEHSVKQVSFGSSHSAAVTFDGSLYTWGSNNYGQLGDGTTTQRTRPIKIMENVKHVSLGGLTSAAITTDGSLYTWGYNGNGQLGDGSTTIKVTPVKIMDNVKAISLGNNHSAAITSDGSLYLWGHNGYGQIGNGQKYQTQSLPVKIMENVKSVSLGEGHSAAITTDGNLYTWGYNGGRIGDGTTQQRTNPVKIATNVRLVNLGSGYSSAVSNDGALYTWGDNEYGQLGNGTMSESYFPQQICNNIASVSTGGYSSYFGTMYYTPANHYAHTIILTMDGRVFACGKNDFGQLGNGTNSPNPQPNSSANPSFEEITIEDNTLSLISQTADKSIESVGASTTKTARFGGLKAGAIYNFYSLKTKSAEDIFDSENLLYITQAEADENGNLVVTYIPTEDYSMPYEFVASLTHIDLSETIVSDYSVTYNSLVQRYNPTIKFGNYTLYENIDYELNGIYSAVNAGEYVVEITGKGDFVGSLTKTFTINQANVNETEVVGLENQEYTGEPITPNFIVKSGNRTLTKDTDYTVKYQNATDLGLGIVEIKGIGNYTGRKVCWFEISEGDISAYGTCVAIKYQAYTGEDVTPEPTVMMNGNILVKNQDYTVEYKNNSSVGIATLIVRGIGNYTGALTTTFEIIDEKVGDVDLDGYIDINDVTAIQRHLCELETLDEKNLVLADTNGDGTVDISDATHLQMYLADYEVVLGKQS